eukprot:scaffold249317_cov107-Cyclotella_meneghiniana.AAC.2
MSLQLLIIVNHSKVPYHLASLRSREEWFTRPFWSLLPRATRPTYHSALNLYLEDRHTCMSIPPERRRKPPLDS